MLIDSHAHLTGEELYPQIEAVLERALAADVRSIINISTDLSQLEAGLSLSKKYPWVHQSAAVHPHDVENEAEAWFAAVSKAARGGQLVAIGETGLDYHYQFAKREVQHLFLKRHLELASECNLPVVIHCREAFEDFYKIYDQANAGKGLKGVLHCFTGTLEEAKQGLDRGLYISFSGIVTFKKSVELREVVKIVPENRLLIETDAPFLAPQSRRGKLNEPAFVRETAEGIAAMRGISLAELGQVTVDNTKELFKIAIENYI